MIVRGGKVGKEEVGQTHRASLGRRRTLLVPDGDHYSPSKDWNHLGRAPPRAPPWAEDMGIGSPWPSEGGETEVVLRHLSCLRYALKWLG